MIHLKGRICQGRRVSTQNAIVPGLASGYIDFLFLTFNCSSVAEKVNADYIKCEVASDSYKFSQSHTGCKSLSEEADLPKSLNLVSDTCSKNNGDDLPGSVP